MLPIPEITLGCAGAGKTSALLNIVDEELSRGTPPDRIGYLSFTRQAATVAIDRAIERFGLTRKQLPWCRTLHSLAFKALGLSHGDVFDGRHVKDFANYARVELTGRVTSADGTREGFTPGDRALFMENLARVRCVALQEQYHTDNDNLPWSRVEQISKALAVFKKTKGLLDYSDMLADAEATGAVPQLDVLIIDEAQDQSKLQVKLIMKLAARARRFIIGGDESQLIFAWAGATADFIGLPGKLRLLDQSLRVPKVVYPLAEAVIQRVRGRRQTTWHPRPGDPGQISRWSHFGQADITGQDILVLARNSFILDEQIEPELRRAGIIYERHGRPSVRPAVLMAIVAWERLRKGGRATIGEVKLVYDLMSPGIGVSREHKHLRDFTLPEEEVTIEDLKEHGGLRTEASWLNALDRIPGKDRDYIRAALARGEKVDQKPRVRLSTIHGAKGAEAEHVILMREMAKRTYDEMHKDPDAEARVWFVGLTRTKQHLSLVESQTNLRCPWV